MLPPKGVTVEDGLALTRPGTWGFPFVKWNKISQSIQDPQLPLNLPSSTGDGGQTGALILQNNRPRTYWGVGGRCWNTWSW